MLYCFVKEAAAGLESESKRLGLAIDESIASWHVHCNEDPSLDHKGGKTNEDSHCSWLREPIIDVTDIIQRQCPLENVVEALGNEVQASESKQVYMTILLKLGYELCLELLSASPLPYLILSEIWEKNYCKNIDELRVAHSKYWAMLQNRSGSQFVRYLDSIVSVVWLSNS